MPDAEMPVIPAGSTPGGDTHASPPDANNTPSEPGSEPVKTPDEGFIPRSVFNERMKKKDEEMEALKADLEEIKTSSVPKEDPKPDEDGWGDDDTPVTKKELKEFQAKQAQEAEQRKLSEALQNRHNELEKKHDGTNGLPKYSKKEIEAYARKNQFYPQDPLDIYNKMNHDKIVDLAAQKKVEAAKGEHIEKNKAPKKPDEKDTSKMTTAEYDDYVRAKRSS